MSTPDLDAGWDDDGPAADDDGQPALLELPAAPAGAGPCPRQPWCVRGAGHHGFCAKVTLEEAAERKASGLPRKRVRPSRAKSSAGGARSAPTASRAPSAGMRPLLGMIWAGLGQLIENYAPEPAGPPVGRVIQFEAPYVSAHLHPVLRQVPIYKRMDEMTGGLFDDLGPILLAPLIVGIMAANPAAQSVLQPMLFSQLESMAVEMAEESRRTRDKLAKKAEYDSDTQAILQALAGELFTPRPPAADAPEPGGHGPGAGVFG